MNRRATIQRKTRETDITLELALDGTGRTAIATGIAWAVLLFGLLLTAPAWGLAAGSVVVPVGAGLASAFRPDAQLSEARRSLVAVGIALLTLPLVGMVSLIVLFLIVCGPQLLG